MTDIGYRLSEISQDAEELFRKRDTLESELREIDRNLREARNQYRDLSRTWIGDLPMFRRALSAKDMVA